MDAAAILKGHGWRGTGHSLDNHGRGIVKPLLISNKQDVLGVGKKKPAHNVSDQWWMRAFDESLKELGRGTKTTLGQVRENGINRGGLYGFFVRGEGLQGTISSTEENSVAESATASTITSGIHTPNTSGDNTPPTSATDSAEDMAGSSDAATSNKRKRQSGKQTDDVRKRRKEERQEKRKKKAEKRDKTLEDRTLYLKNETEKTQVQELNRKASELIKKAAQHREFEPILPHPSMPQLRVNTQDKTNGQAKESEEMVNSFGAMHADRMMMIQNGISSQSHGKAEVPGKPGKKLPYNAGKCARKQAVRVVKSEFKARLLPEAQASGTLPNLEIIPPKAQHKEDEEEGKAGSEVEDAERKTAKAKRREEKDWQKQERREAKKARKLEKSGNQSKSADTHLEQREIKEQATNAVQGFENNSDEIKSRPQIPGKRSKKVSGYGLTEKQPSRKKRREQGAADKAAEMGASSEEHKADSKIKRKQKPLTEEQKEQYAARAAEKSMTIEAYLARRAEKKAQNKTQRSSKAMAKPEATTLGFVIGTTSNKDLLSQIKRRTKT